MRDVGAPSLRGSVGRDHPCVVVSQLEVQPISSHMQTDRKPTRYLTEGVTEVVRVRVCVCMTAQFISMRAICRRPSRSAYSFFSICRSADIPVSYIYSTADIARYWPAEHLSRQQSRNI